jgi:reactive chlorine resistance protein C
MLEAATGKEDEMTSIGSAHTNLRDSAGPRGSAPRSPVASLEDRYLGYVESAGIGVLRAGLVFLLLLYGSFKFFAFEAEAIEPLLANSPFMAWLYPLLGVQGTSNLIGVFEVATALLMATRPWWPRVSGYASLAASLTFVVTLSFLFTTPGGLDPFSPAFGFLIKDILLLGAALLTAAEALRGAGVRRD